MTRRTFATLVPVALAWIGGPAMAQPTPRPDEGILAKLVGAWQGSGTILGQASALELRWTRELDGRFVRLTHDSRIGPAPRTVRFEGHAYYQALPSGGYRGTWFDSSGLTRPITGVTRDDALVASWGAPDTEEGETTYRLVAGDRLEVVDRVKSKDGTWREFGRTQLSRTLPPG